MLVYTGEVNGKDAGFDTFFSRNSNVGGTEFEILYLIDVFKKLTDLHTTRRSSCGRNENVIVRASFGWLSMQPVRLTFGCLLRMFMPPLRPTEILKHLIPKRPPFSFFLCGDRPRHTLTHRKQVHFLVSCFL